MAAERRSSITRFVEWRRESPPKILPWWVAGASAVIFVAWRLTLTTLEAPGSPWLGYEWFLLLLLGGAGAWTIFARQRKELDGDKAFCWWVWHFVTGTSLVVVNNPKLPWWRDVLACWPFLDTARAEPCPDDGRWQCVARRAVTGAGRVLATAGLVLVEYGRSGAPHGLGPRALISWGLGGTLALVLAVLVIATAAVGVARWTWYYRPLHIALHERAGHAAGRRPRSWIHLPRSFESAERRERWWQLWRRRHPGIRLRFALDYLLSADNKTKTLELVFGVLGLRAEDVDVEWDPEGRREHLTITKARRVPDRAVISNETVRAAIERVTGRWAYLVGFTNGWTPVVQSLEADAPHVLIAGPTKVGKSQLLKVILWQLMRKTRKLGRPRIYVFDVKGYSHLELEGRPGVVYCRSPAEIAAALLEIAALGLERGVEVLAERRANREPEFPPVFVIFEDMGAAFPKVKKRPGVAQAWDDILSLGRGVAIHAFTLPHRPDMRYLGQGAVRDNLGNVMLMSGHGKEAKTMVASEADYELPEMKRGRFVTVNGRVGIHTQGVLDDIDLIESELDELLGPKAIVEEPRGRRTSPPGATPLVGRPPQAPGAPSGSSTVPGGAGVMAEPPQPQPASSVLPAAGAPGTVPEEAGVMADEPQPQASSRRSVAPTSHSPSTSRWGVPPVVVSRGAGGNGGTVPEDGPDPVTLREGYERDPDWWGVEYETLTTWRKRAKRAMRAGKADAWFPSPIEVRAGSGDSEVEVYHYPELRRAWKSRPRSAPDDGVWWCYFMVQGGLPALRYGVIVKIGWTNDLERRCTDFGNHYPDDVVYVEQFPSERAARAAEKAYHDRWTREMANGRGQAPAGVSLRRYPHGGGGRGGREQFWCEGTLAAFVASVTPSPRQEAV